MALTSTPERLPVLDFRRAGGSGNEREAFLFDLRAVAHGRGFIDSPKGRMIPTSTKAAASGRAGRSAIEHRAAAGAKRGGSRASSKPGDTTVPVPLPPDLVRALQAWIASRPAPPPDFPEAIRFALREWLMARELRDHLGQADA